MSELGDDAFGFVWGQVKVTRIASLPTGHKVVRIETAHDSIDVYVAPKGRKVRAFRGNEELS